MKRFLFGLIFVVASFVNVRVHAETLSMALDEEVVDLPAGCFESHQTPCALKTHKDRKFRVQIGRQEIILGSDSSCSLNTDPLSKEKIQIQLLRGEFLVFTEAEMVIKIPAGSLHLPAGARALMDYSGERTLMRPLRGLVEVQPLVSEDAFSVLPGQENWLGRVRADHHVAAGLPLTTGLRKTLADWSRLTYAPKAEFKEQAESYRATWEKQHDDTAELLKNTIQENVAGNEAKTKSRQLAAQSARREQLELRKMLWENTFELPQSDFIKAKSRRPANSQID